MEMLNFVLIFAAGYLVWRRPEREGLAYALLVTSVVVATLLSLSRRAGPSCRR